MRDMGSYRLEVIRHNQIKDPVEKFFDREDYRVAKHQYEIYLEMKSLLGPNELNDLECIFNTHNFTRLRLLSYSESQRHGKKRRSKEKRILLDITHGRK